MTAQQLRSLDLFSGIGGMSHALRGVAKTVAYCDSSASARDVLRNNMDRGRLDVAPICNDVRDMGKRWLRKNAVDGVDVLVAGVPCIGFSTAGKKQGLRQEQSALFVEVIRIVDEVMPSLVFLENVANILNTDGMAFVMREMHIKRRYELRWCTLTAQAVGSPQLRRRWYCLAVHPKRAAAMQFSCPRYTPHTWTPASEPERAKCTDDVALANSRLRLLGNSVVPDAVRYAFCFLAAGFRQPLRRSEFFFYNRVCPVSDTGVRVIGRARRPWPKCGGVRCNAMFSAAQPRRLPATHTFQLEFVPGAFKSKVPPRTTLTSGVHTEPVRSTHWGTPVYSKISGPANFLTRRHGTTLLTQIRFERDTPDHLRGCKINPEFVEWLMGFPHTWTQVTGPRTCAPPPPGQSASGGTRPA